MSALWMTFAELAAAKLPDLPHTKRGIAELAARERWEAKKTKSGRPVWRERAGRGGGREWLASAVVGLLAREELIRRGMIKPEPIRVTPPEVAAETAALPMVRHWDAYERLPASAKAEAVRRAAVLAEVDRWTPIKGRSAAVRLAANAASPPVATSTVWSWIEKVASLPRDQRVLALAPRPRGKPERKDVQREALDLFKSNWLRLSQPTYEQCYRELQAVAAKEGWSIPSQKTLVRRLHEEVEPRAILLAREGKRALEASTPHQIRDRSAFQPMEAVCADGHKWDIWVEWPDGRTVRPVSIAFQDLASNKILSVRHGIGENVGLVQLALHDMVRDFGIPDHCWLDNGRAFASKAMTGGAPWRHRFRAKPDDPQGLLVQLGTTVHWTQVAHGQAKPIERAFGDFARDISRHSAFDGAYTGNAPHRKPENAGTKAVPFELFTQIVAEGVAAHNARTGRRTRACGGTLSFDQVFEEGFATRIAAIPSARQLRAMLLAAEPVSVRKPDGSVFLNGNRYWSEALLAHAGARVVLRADPDALHEPVAVYDLSGSFLCEAACVEATGFADTEAARRHAQAKRGLIRATKEALATARPHSPSEVAAIVLADSRDLPEAPRPAARRLVTGLAVAAQAAPAADAFDDVLEMFGRAQAARAASHLRLVEPETGA